MFAYSDFAYSFSSPAKTVLSFVFAPCEFKFSKNPLSAKTASFVSKEAS